MHVAAGCPEVTIGVVRGVVANCAVITSSVVWLESCVPLLPLANPIAPPWVDHSDPDADGKKAILDMLLRQSTCTVPKPGTVMSTTPEEEVVSIYPRTMVADPML